MFTENQVRQFYVATSTGDDVIAPVEVDSTHKATDLNAKSAGACQFVIGPNKDEAFIMYKGPSDDGLQKSDILKKNNVKYVSLTDAADMAHKKNELLVTLDSNVSTTAITGQDYILNVTIKNYIANGDDSTKIKFGAARAFSTTASDLYKALAINLAKNMSREPAKLLKVYLATSITESEGAVTAVSLSDEVTGKSSQTLSGTYVGIVLEEVEQPWRRGAAKQEFVNFEAQASTIYASGVERVWGKTVDITAINTNTIPNSKRVADMEYFFHKERGDIYGEVGFPNNIDTTYQVEPANASGYSFVDIHFYELGNSHNVGMSEKTLTVVGTKTNLKKLIGVATSGSETGLYKFLKGTDATIKTSTNW